MPRIENGENPQTGLRGLDGVKAAKLEEINESFAEAEKAVILCRLWALRSTPPTVPTVM